MFLESKVNQKVFFLNMDNQSAFVLCQAMLTKHNVEWRDPSQNNSASKNKSENSASADDNKSEDGVMIAGESANVEAFIAELEAFFGKNVVVSSCLEECALKRLQLAHKTIATAESCTGGLLAYCFTKNAGASLAFLGGIISYANTIKEQNLGVNPYTLQNFGAVSHEVVSEMLEGALDLFGADIALATSGIAGPGGGSVKKPVGTVFIGMQKRGEKPVIERHLFGGNRVEIQQHSCIKALEILLKNL